MGPHWICVVLQHSDGVGSADMGGFVLCCSILTGSVVPIWGTLEKVLERHEGNLSKSDRSMRAVRAEPEGGQRLIGIRWDAMHCQMLNLFYILLVQIYPSATHYGLF